MIMAKVQKVPSGYYTAQQAAKRLGLPEATFHYQVKTGKIKKLIPPGRREGFYSKKEIEKLAQAQELFVLLNSVEPVIFDRATSEDDVRGIVDLCVAIYGVGGTPSYEARLAIWHKNPYVYYVVKQEDIVVGYISLIWFDDEALNVLMGPTPKTPHQTQAGNGVYSITGVEHVRTFTSGHPIESLFVSLAVRPGMSNEDQRFYAFKLLRDTVDILENFARQGMPVRKLVATSEKQDGMMLARKLGMREIKHSDDRLLRYELDLETSDTPLARQYQQFVYELEKETGQEVE